MWYLNGLIHRIDGPAVTYKNGTGLNLWYLHGKGIKNDDQQIETWIKTENIDLKTEEGQMAFVLRWS